MTQQAGFSLVELLVALSIVGFIMAMAPTVFGRSKSTMDARAGASILADDLRQARLDAITSGEERDVRFDVEHARYEMPWRSKSRIIPPSLRMSFTGPRHNTSAHGALIAFFPDGSSSGGAVTLSTPTKSFTVSSHWLTGRVAVDE